MGPLVFFWRNGMKLFLCLALFAAFAAVRAENVLTVDGEDSFNDIISKHKFVVMEFYAPWCGHCKRLEPEYEKAATELLGFEPEITLAKLDATEDKNRALGDKFGVRGFPTLKIFRDGDAENAAEYNGPRQAEGIVKYLKKQVEPAVKDLADEAAVKEFADADKVVVIGFAAADSAEATAFAGAANKLRDNLNFGLVTDASVAGAFEVTAPAVLVLKKFDEGRAVFSGEWNADEITTFVQDESRAVVDKLDQANELVMKAFFESKLPKVLLFSNENGDSHAKELEAVQTACKALKGKTFCVWVSADFQAALQHFGIEEGKLPAILVDHTEDEKKFMYDGEVTDGAAVQQFVQDTLDGKIEAHVKSEPIPEDNNGPVTTVVGKNYEEIINSGKDVFLEAYAPWCGHCKKLVPIWDSLGETFKDEDRVVIAKVDATANDLPKSLGVRGFPTLLFFPAGETEPIKYEKDRTLASMVDFVKANAKAQDLKIGEVEGKEEL